jgi:DNA-binding HxlR family transcriptional regulator
MSKRPSSTTDLVVAAAELLGRRQTTRVLSELTDHGPVPLGEVAATFSDLAHDQYTYRLQVLRERGLIAYGKDTGRDCYVLTPAGEGVGDVHHCLSGWARKHAFPAQTCDFETRIEHGLRLLEGRHLLTLLADPGTARASGLDPDTERSLTASGFMYVMRDGEPALTAAGQDLRGPATALTSWARDHADLLQRRTDTRRGLRTTIPRPARQTPAARRPG